MDALDPWDALARWFPEAQTAEPDVPDAMQVATVGADGRPTLRTVLLKEFGPEQGLVFFTNYGSRKARDLDENPRAALCFHWAVLQRQVRVSGTVSRVSAEESAAYFATRGRGSQIGAWASRQSERLGRRDELEQRVRDADARFPEGDVPRPPFWGGYRLVPARIEFWQGRADRLHDRLVFSRDGGAWRTERLYP